MNDDPTAPILTGGSAPTSLDVRPPYFRQGLAGWALALLVVVLMSHFALRSHRILAQQPYLDEGFHVKHAATIYDFESHPGRVAHGKILIYFYLAFFEANPTVALFMARLGVALFSLLTGAALARLGAMLHRPATGLLAAALYAVFPLGFFFDRMALSDGFVTAFMVLALIQSLRLARRPTMGQGVLLGIVLGLMTLAKLTAGLLPLLAPLAAYLYARRPWRDWLRVYLPPLLVAALVVVLMWLPILIPALAAHFTDDPFTLVDSNAFNEVRGNPFLFAMGLFPKVMGFVHPLFAALIVGLVVYWYRARRPPLSPNHMTLLLMWLLLFVGLILLTARISSSRYFAPVAAMLAIMVAYALTTLTAARAWRPVMFVGGGVLLWVVWFVAPFAHQSIYHPTELVFYRDYNGEYKTDPVEIARLQTTATALDALAGTQLYAEWSTCYMLYFYMQRDLTCLPRVYDNQAFVDAVTTRLAADEAVYIVWNRDPIAATLPWLRWQEAVQQPDRVWRLFRVAATDTSLR